MPEATKTELKKLKNTEVDALKGKLLEVRRIGATPIFIKVTKTDSVAKALEKADIPTDDDIKVEGMTARAKTWNQITLKEKVHKYNRIAVTTKISGA